MTLVLCTILKIAVDRCHIAINSVLRSAIEVLSENQSVFIDYQIRAIRLFVKPMIKSRMWTNSTNYTNLAVAKVPGIHQF